MRKTSFKEGRVPVALERHFGQTKERQVLFGAAVSLVLCKLAAGRGRRARDWPAVWCIPARSLAKSICRLVSKGAGPRPRWSGQGGKACGGRPGIPRPVAGERWTPNRLPRWHFAGRHPTDASSQLGAVGRVREDGKRSDGSLGSARMRFHCCGDGAARSTRFRSLNQTYRLTIMYRWRSHVYWLGCWAKAWRVFR